MGLRAATTEAFSMAAKMGAIDFTFLDRVTFRDRTLAREVLVLFGKQAESLCAEIAATSDARRRREAAHKLKGAARGVGAFDVAAAAEDVETAQDAAEFGAAFARLTARVTEARIALAGLVDKT
jgi:HPt (histidine-containing phosphotransfer) domain-containing protein